MSEIIDFPSQPMFPEIEEALGSELLDTGGDHTPRHTAKIVEKNHARVQSILAARSMGLGMRQVCKLYEVSPHTVAALEQKHRAKLATMKEIMARKFAAFAELGIDRAINEVDKMDIDKLMVSLGIAVDKMQVLTGEASVIVGTPDTGKRFSIESLNERLGRTEINVTGSVVAESSPTREAPVPAPLPSPSSGSSSAGSDTASDCSDCK
jgi:hypothetical protein